MKPYIKNQITIYIKCKYVTLLSLRIDCIGLYQCVLSSGLQRQIHCRPRSCHV